MARLGARIDDLVGRHPTGPLALRAALAALAAWLLVQPLGGVADEYPYYAPLGAVASVSTSVQSSIRLVVQVALALVLGAVLAAGALLSPLPQPVALLLVVGLGTIVATWRHLGSLGSWVPISALFMLVIGHRDPGDYLLAYVALTTVGAVVGALVNAAVPPLRLAPAARAQDDLRATLVEQLDQLADGLEQDPLPSPDDWAGRRYDLEPRARRVQELTGDAVDGPPVNWRVRRSQDRADQVSTQGRALVNLAFLVGELATDLTTWEHAERDEVPLGPDLRPYAARALRQLARVLRSVDVAHAEPDDVEGAWQEVRAFTDAVRDARRRTGMDLFEAGTLVVGIERTLGSVGR